MFTNFFYKIKDAWTYPLYKTPRWLQANGYSDLFDSVPLPPIIADTCTASALSADYWATEVHTYVTKYNLPLSSSGWQNTGIYLPPNSVFTISATGQGKWDFTYAAYPDGSPGWPGFPISGTALATGIAPFSLAVVVSNGTPAIPYANPLFTGYGPQTFTTSGGFLWAGFNDLQGAHPDNSGGFVLTVTTTGLITNEYSIQKYNDSVVSTSGSGYSLLQRFFDAFSMEKEALLIPLINTFLSRSTSYDVTEPEFAWIVETSDLKKVNSVQIYDYEGNLVDVTKANNIYDFFYSSNWRWISDNDFVLVYGLQIREQFTRPKYLDWQFIECTEHWTSGSTLWFEQPNTKNWIPVHGTKPRADGFVNFYYENNSRVRYINNTVALSSGFSSIQCFVNGEPRTLRRINLSNTVDAKAYLMGISRRADETNNSLSEIINSVYWFGGQNKKSVRANIASNLRSFNLRTVSRTSSSIDLTSGNTGACLRNVSPVRYITETEPIRFGNAILSKYADGVSVTAFVNGVQTNVTKVGSGLLSFDSNLTAQDAIEVSWKLINWTQNSSSIVFTDNWKKLGEDLILHESFKVSVNEPSISTLKKAFAKSFPGFRWKTNLESPNYSGLATFDF